MRTAEFRIFLGNKAYWTRGIGTECTKLMVVYGFEKLNLNRIWLGVNADNIGGVRAYEKAGFIKEGILRQEQYRNFRYYDVVRMSVLRSEYEKLRKGYLEREREVP
jgi:RimJ/RimL family protein N-acetyltransferase